MKPTLGGKESMKGKSPDEGVRPMEKGKKGGNYEAPGGGITKRPEAKLRRAQRQHYEAPRGGITKRPEA